MRTWSQREHPPSIRLTDSDFQVKRAELIPRVNLGGVFGIVIGAERKRNGAARSAAEGAEVERAERSERGTPGTNAGAKFVAGGDAATARRSGAEEAGDVVTPCNEGVAEARVAVYPCWSEGEASPPAK